MNLALNKNNSLKYFGLRYTNEKDLYFKRTKRGKGFQYVNLKDKVIKNKTLLCRFKSLVIPPAWEEVFICKYNNGHIQVIGKDNKGRKQYIYHEKWEEFRSSTKFNRLIKFAESLPKIRKRIEKDFKQKITSKNKVLSLIIKLLEETLIRIGNEKYAEENKSYGLTTLRNKHMKKNGSGLTLKFQGKSGKTFEYDINDKKIVNAIKKCQDLPGQQLFQYIDEDGNQQSIDSSDVNEYLNSIVENNFTAKDFRTWGATTFAAKLLSKYYPADNDVDNNKNVIKVVKATAKELNNTPAICKKYYIHPDVLNAYNDKYIFQVFTKSLAKNKYGLTSDEKAVLRILKHYSKNSKYN